MCLFLFIFLWQEPYQWASVAAISRKYLAIRYSLLPYYYTLFYQANHSSSVNDFQPSYGMVLHPLFIHFPTDATACGIDSQFMVGGALLIAPQCNIGTLPVTIANVIIADVPPAH